MKNLPITEVPEHLRPTRWRCPLCRLPAVVVGVPEVRVDAPGVSGGEWLVYECETGHRISPHPGHFALPVR